MKLNTLALVAAFSAFGISAEAQTCSTLCDEDFWKTASQAEVAAELSKADVSARDVRDRTALMFAAWYGTVENVKVLSDEKLMPGLLNLDVTGERIYSYLNRRDTYSETALMFAARWGTAENVKFLLTIRAAHTSQLAVDGSLINSSGKTAFDLAENNEKLKNTDAYWLLSDARFK